MGVNGLWQVVQPCARPTSLATLNRKRLAVDASIWIYQFLKAVRDKEGNALRNSHVVGFFRRICKLLWYGILPVFVFDGGAPALKRATINARKRRREGRRDDAVRTAGKLLAVQMQRAAEEEEQRRRRRRRRQEEQQELAPGGSPPQEPAEELPDMDKIVYQEELGMSQQERQRNRAFRKQDAYHLPELAGGISSMGNSEDPRIMSVEELEEYARQFNSGEDINLYDFSKIDFDGEFFKSLPPADRYNILNAARIRSRLRMGLSKEQLDEMFPDRMAFSMFQIERVKERNHLTQRLMSEVGMNGTDLTLGVNGRVAGEKDREYILVKNEGVEGGWALGVVSKEKDKGEVQNPIDVDALQFQYQTKDETDDDDEDFEDVPIEGLNRLPKLNPQAANGPPPTQDGDIEESLFVDEGAPQLLNADGVDLIQADEDEDLDRAIAMSLKTQHGAGGKGEGGSEAFEDVPGPEWTQKAVEGPNPIAKTSGRMVAHIVNNRSNAAVPKRRDSHGSSDSDTDIRTAMAAARKKQKVSPAPRPPPAAPPNVKNPFDGPLPFEKLHWRSSAFLKETPGNAPEAGSKLNNTSSPGVELHSEPEELAGGFERNDTHTDEPRPAPPWLLDNTDIREHMKKQQENETLVNEEDREMALEEERLYRRRRQDEVVEIESSDEDGSDVELIASHPSRKPEAPQTSNAELTILQTSQSLKKDMSQDHRREKTPEVTGDEPSLTPPEPRGPMQEASILEKNLPEPSREDDPPKSPSPEEEVEFEDVVPPRGSNGIGNPIDAHDPQMDESAEIDFEDLPLPAPQAGAVSDGPKEGMDNDPFADVEYDEFSDPEEEELLVQMAEEAQEHARFASSLNNKSESDNQEAYERELRALRSQQKKDRRDADEVTQIMITECQSLLRLFGIPYITAPMEAEAQCAELVHLGLVDGIVTDDSDIFLFGGTRVYKNMFNSNKFVECYLTSDLEKEMSLAREQLISLAQLLGSDYTEGLPGIGPVSAVEILSEFPGGLEDFRQWWQSVQAAEGRAKETDADAASPFRRKFRRAQGKKLFLPPGFPSPVVAEAYLRPEVDRAAEPFRWGVPDLDGLRRFLTATIGWGQDRTDEVLVPVIRDMNKREAEGTQSNITRFFSGAVGVGARDAFAPRHRVAGSKRMAEAVSRLRAHASTDGYAAAGGGGGAGASASDQVPVETSTRKRKARAAAAAAAARASADDDEDDEDADGDEADRTRKGKGKGKKRARGKRAKASA